MKLGTKKDGNGGVYQLLRHVDLPGDVGACWNWRGAISCHGKQPCIVVKGNRLSANRYAWEVYKGPIPAGMMVRRRCENFRCVNPDHLFLVTRSQNSTLIGAKETPAKLYGYKHRNNWHWKFMVRKNGAFVRRAA